MQARVNVLSSIKPSVVRTWSNAAANSERFHGSDVFLSQELFKGGSVWNHLQTLGRVFEEEVLSQFGLEQFECRITASGPKLSLRNQQNKTKQKYIRYKKVAFSCGAFFSKAAWETRPV